AANVLGPVGGGFMIAQARLGPGRIHHCMRAIGGAERGLEMMCRRANGRVAFGEPLAKKQFVQDMVATSRMEIDQARLLCLYAAWKMDTVGKKEARQEISMIKVVAANVFMNVLDRAILVHEGPERQRDDHPAYDPMVQAAVVAEATRRVRIGHLVLCNLFRHPAVTARSLATLDELSGGRLVAGLGSGWTETEFRMTGIAFPEVTTRLRMLDEALTCIRGLWGGEPFSFAGELY